MYLFTLLSWFECTKRNCHNIAFLFSLFALNEFEYTGHSNTLLRIFDSFLLSFGDKVTTDTYIFLPLIVKIILELVKAFSGPGMDKTQCFLHLSFNSTLQLIN